MKTENKQQCRYCKNTIYLKQPKALIQDTNYYCDHACLNYDSMAETRYAIGDIVFLKDEKCTFKINDITKSHIDVVCYTFGLSEPFASASATCQTHGWARKKLNRAAWKNLIKLHRPEEVLESESEEDSLFPDSVYDASDLSLKRTQALLRLENIFGRSFEDFEGMYEDKQ